MFQITVHLGKYTSSFYDLFGQGAETKSDIIKTIADT